MFNLKVEILNSSLAHKKLSEKLGIKILQSPSILDVGEPKSINIFSFLNYGKTLIFNIAFHEVSVVKFKP